MGRLALELTAKNGRYRYITLMYLLLNSLGLHTERYRSTLYASYLHGFIWRRRQRAASVFFPVNFLTCRARIPSGRRVRRYGFQSSCKINKPFHVFSQHIPVQLTLFLTYFTLSQTRVSWLWLCVTHIPVCQSCVNRSKGQLKCE